MRQKIHQGVGELGVSFLFFALHCLFTAPIKAEQSKIYLQFIGVFFHNIANGFIGGFDT